MELGIHKNQQIVLKKIEALNEALAHQRKLISKSLNSLTLIKAVKQKIKVVRNFKFWNRIIEETVVDIILTKWITLEFYLKSNGTDEKMDMYVPRPMTYKITTNHKASA